MKRKIIISLAVMSMCFCSCEQTASTEPPKTSVTETKQDTISTSKPQTTTTQTPETKATNTPKAEASKTSAPQKTPTSNPNTKNEMLTLASKTDLNSFKHVETLTLADSTNADFVIHSDTTLKDLTVNNVSSDGETYKIEKKVYEVAQFTNTDAIHIKTYIPDLFSNLLITYKDSNNKTIYKVVCYDMTGDTDDNLILQDVDSKMIKKN